MQCFAQRRSAESNDVSTARLVRHAVAELLRSSTGQDWARYHHANHFQNRMSHDDCGKILADARFVQGRDEPADFADPAGLDLRPELCTGKASDHATRAYWRLSPRAA